MEHVINAKYGDTIVINIPAKPKAVKKQIILMKENAAIGKTHIELVNKVCTALDITLEQLQGKCRTSEIVTARFYVAHYLREQGVPLTAIGKLLHRDHTTVIHAVRTYEQRVAVRDSLTIEVVNTIKQYEAAKN